MSNLISRSELLEEIKYLSIVLNGKQIFSDDAKDTVLRIIKEQPTAYSVDKVVEELEELKNRYDKNDFAIRGIIEKAIEIVKQGGVGTETETIRYKAIKWNNNSSKRVPYEFIDFVEGKRDIGVTDDVCEWKKCSSGSADFYVYSSKCLNKNIKEIGTTTNFIDDFKYCPYCGKKIKVVE